MNWPLCLENFMFNTFNVSWFKLFTKPVFKKSKTWRSGVWKFKIKILDSNKNLDNCDILAWLNNFKGIKQNWSFILFSKIIFLLLIIFEFPPNILLLTLFSISFILYLFYYLFLLFFARSNVRCFADWVNSVLLNEMGHFCSQIQPRWYNWSLAKLVETYPSRLSVLYLQKINFPRFWWKKLRTSWTSPVPCS